MRSLTIPNGTSEQDRMTRAVLDTDLLGVDSLDKSVFEEEQMETRVYGKRNVEKQVTRSVTFRFPTDPSGTV